MNTNLQTDYYCLVGYCILQKMREAPALVTLPTAVSEERLNLRFPRHVSTPRCASGVALLGKTGTSHAAPVLLASNELPPSHNTPVVVELTITKVLDDGDAGENGQITWI